jgi:hypothetical protein
MRSNALILSLFALFIGGQAKAQTSLQRAYLESVGFEYVSQTQSAKRCVQWRDLVNKNPQIRFEGGNPFVVLELEARVEGDCPLKFANGESLNFVAGQGSIKIFRFKVSPPSASFLVSGPGFSDQLVFEALISRPEQLNFFKFFENSQTRFDLAYGTFSTTNRTVPVAADRSSKVFPIMSGLITVPFPWHPRLQFGFSMSQNLSNILPDSKVQFQFSEFTFDGRYSFLIGSSKGLLSLIAELRGRNWYQLGSMENDPPFVVRSSPGAGFGADYEGWVGNTRWGYSLSGRYGFRSAQDAKAKGEMRAGASANYKLNDKWAMGIGYRWTRLGVDFTNSAAQSGLGVLHEQSHLIGLSLMLITGRGGSN